MGRTVGSVLWGRAPSEWAQILCEELNAKVLTPDFVGVDSERLRQARDQGAGEVVREDGEHIATFGEGPTLTLSTIDAPSLSDPWQAALANGVLRQRIVRKHVEAGVQFDTFKVIFHDEVDNTSHRF